MIDELLEENNVELMAAWIMDEVRYWKGKEKIREKNAGSKDLLD